MSISIFSCDSILCTRIQKRYGEVLRMVSEVSQPREGICTTVWWYGSEYICIFCDCRDISLHWCHWCSADVCQSCSGLFESPAAEPSWPGPCTIHASLWCLWCFQEEFSHPVESLALTVDEVINVRRVLVKAEMEKFLQSKELYNNLKKGKVTAEPSSLLFMCFCAVFIVNGL